MGNPWMKSATTNADLFDGVPLTHFKDSKKDPQGNTHLFDGYCSQVTLNCSGKTTAYSDAQYQINDNKGQVITKVVGAQNYPFALGGNTARIKVGEPHTYQSEEGSSGNRGESGEIRLVIKEKPAQPQTYYIPYRLMRGYGYCYGYGCY